MYQQFDTSASRSMEEKQEAFKFIFGTTIVSGEQLENLIYNTNLSIEALSAIVDSMKKNNE